MQSALTQKWQCLLTEPSGTARQLPSLQPPGPALPSRAGQGGVSPALTPAAAGGTRSEEMHHLSGA